MQHLVFGWLQFPIFRQSLGIRMRFDGNLTLGYVAVFGFHYTILALYLVLHSFYYNTTHVHKNDKCFLLIFNEALMIFFDRIWVVGVAVTV